MAQITFQMKLGVENRKHTAGIITEALGTRAEYRGAPAFQYEVGRWLLTKDGGLISPPIDQQRGTTNEMEAVFRALAADGVAPVGRMAVEIVGMDAVQARNMTAILISKANLLYRAFRFGEDGGFSVQDGVACLDFFEGTLDVSAVKANLLFAARLADLAGKLTRVTAKERETDNDRFVFRCFLLRLGFIGDEYKQSRKLLMQNLEGNGSWRSGHAPTTGAPAPNLASDEHPDAEL